MSMMTILRLAATTGLFATSVSAQTPGLDAADRVRLAEAFRLADQVAYPFWPGWRDVPFPILLITADTEFLVRHPNPSADFIPLGHDTVLGSDILSRPRTLPTRIAAALPINGRYTVSIGQQGLLGTSSSTSWVLTLLHEHFHQLQFSDSSYFQEVTRLKSTVGDTSSRWMVDHPFPYDSPPVAASFARLSQALYRALISADGTDFDAAMRAFRVAWQDFRDRLRPEDYAYLDFQLWQEGVPRYLEHKLATLAATGGYEPSAAFRELDDYRPYERLAASFARRNVEDLPELDLARDRREIVYPFGAALALLLDRASPGWKERYSKERFSIFRYFDP